MSQTATQEASRPVAVPPIVDQETWDAALADLRAREKAATRELDAIAAARRRLPMVELPDYTLEGADGPVRLVDVFEGKHQLIVYNHMWFPGGVAVPGMHGFTSQFTRLEFLDNYDARFVIVTQGPIEDALAYKARVGNKMTWYSTANSSFGADMGAPPGGASRSTCSSAPATRCTGPTTPRGAAPSSSVTASPSSTSCHTGARKSGRTHPRVGRSRRPTAGGRPRRSSPATPTDGPQAACQLITGGARAARRAALVGQRERGDQHALVSRRRPASRPGCRRPSAWPCGT